MTSVIYWTGTDCEHCWKIWTHC